MAARGPRALIAVLVLAHSARATPCSDCRGGIDEDNLSTTQRAESKSDYKRVCSNGKRDCPSTTLVEVSAGCTLTRTRAHTNNPHQEAIRARGVWTRSPVQQLQIDSKASYTPAVAASASRVRAAVRGLALRRAAVRARLDGMILLLRSPSPRVHILLSTATKRPPGIYGSQLLLTTSRKAVCSGSFRRLLRKGRRDSA